MSEEVSYLERRGSNTGPAPAGTRHACRRGRHGHSAQARVGLQELFDLVGAGGGGQTRVVREATRRDGRRCAAIAETQLLHLTVVSNEEEDENGEDIGIGYI